MDNKLCFAFVSVSFVFTTGYSPGLEVKTSFRPEHCNSGKVKEGDYLTVHYSGQLDKDGNKFASSWEKNEPKRFRMGTGQVMKGWDKGLLGMCIGEIRTLKVPPELTLGGKDFLNVIPNKSTLYFTIQLILPFFEMLLPVHFPNDFSKICNFKSEKTVVVSQ